MNEVTYRVLMVPNGNLDEFYRGIIGQEVKTWGVYDDLQSAADRVRELAKIESFKEYCAAVEDNCPDIDDIKNAIEKEGDGAGGAQSRLVSALETVCSGFDVRDVILRKGPPSTDDEREDLAYDVHDACMDQERDRFVAGCVESMGFEWDSDLKWIRVAKFNGEDFVEVV